MRCRDDGSRRNEIAGTGEGDAGGFDDVDGGQPGPRSALDDEAAKVERRLLVGFVGAAADRPKLKSGIWF